MCELGIEQSHLLKKIKRFKNYSHYGIYRYKMDITTIQLNKETKDKISSFGMKGDSYDDILKRIYSLAVKEQLREFLLSSENTISIEEARKEAEKLWPRSK